MINSQNNIDITSFINFPIKIDIHEHPLILCICQRQCEWFCVFCSTSYKNTPSFYCTYCDYDLCQKCLGEYRLNQVKKCDKNTKYLNIIQDDANSIFPWQRQFSYHKHFLSIIRKTNKCSWTCNKCSKIYQNSYKSLYYCSLCDYNICDECSKTFEPINKVMNTKRYNTIESKEDINCSGSGSVINNKKDCPTINKNDKKNIIKYSFQQCRTNEIKNILKENKCNTKKIDYSKKYCKYSDRTTRKPVICLYPEKEMDISVQLEINNQNNKFTVLYPKFNEDNNTWKVNAKPNGDIKLGNKIYPYLFWEAYSYNCEEEMNEGFIVKDVDAETFLEEKLKLLGLNDKESTDFITYWLPVLIKNKISLCYFQSKYFFDNFKLNVSPKPDTMIRIFLSIKKINAPFNIKEQKLVKNERKGFTVIEWGGTNY